MEKNRDKSERAVLKSMIQSFRVAELQTLLQRVQINKTGKKNILQERALALLDTMTDEIAQLIHQLHRRRFSTTKNLNYINTRLPEQFHGGNFQQLSTSVQCVGVNQHSNPITAPSEPYMMTESPKFQHVKGGIENGQYVHANENNLYSSSTVSPSKTQNYNAASSHKLIPSSFFDVISTVMAPKVHVPKQVSGHEEVECEFILEMDDLNDLCLSRFRFNPEIDCNAHNPSLQMRVAKMGEPDDFLPVTLSILVNAQALSLPKLVPVTKAPGVMKRQCVPLDISNAIFLSPKIRNKLVLKWDKEDHRAFPCTLGISIHLVRKLTSDILVQRLLAQPSLSENDSLSRLQQKFLEKAEDEIAATTIRASVMCPLGKMILQRPMRSKECTHVQCFDGETFIKMNEKKPSWVCPICDCPISFADIQVDDLWVKILRVVPDQCREVEFNTDGSWSFVKTQPKKSYIVDGFKKGRKSPEVITIDSDSDDDYHQEQPQNHQFPCISVKPSEDTDDVECVYMSTCQALNFGASTSRGLYVPESFSSWYDNGAGNGHRYSHSMENTDHYVTDLFDSDED